MKLTVACTKTGIYDVYVISDDEYLTPTISKGCEWDGWMRRDVRTHHKIGTDILDIGANIGYNTLIFSDYGPVLSFEPIFHQIVGMNVEKNTLRHPVRVIPCALSDEKVISTIHLPTPGKNPENRINYGGASFNHKEDIKGQCVDVQCQRLDDIYTGTPSFLKIDVEGHELRVLKGAEETIKKHKPVILVELHDFSEDHEVHKFMMCMGYDAPVARPEHMFLYSPKSYAIL